MKKFELNIATDRESTEKELTFIKSVFLDHFQFEMRNDIVRLSSGDLPMIIMINVLTGLGSCAIYDLLKIAVEKIIANKSQIKRKTSIVIQEEDTQYIIGRDYVAIRKHAKDTKFESVDSLFEYLSKKKK